jgi:signal transduction histidine kinase/FixJ family two-component response regulator
MENLQATILLIDDRPENLLALEGVLEPLGQRLVKVTSGRQALKFLLHEDCALVLLDVQMPDLDGFETAALIRERPRSRYTPIIFVTALHREEEEIIKGYAHGAVDYIIKPVNPDTLLAKVRCFLDRSRHEGNLRREADESRRRERVAFAEAEEQRARLYSLFMQAPAALAILRGPRHCFELANERFEQLACRTGLLGLPARTALPSLENQGICEILDRVLETRQPFVGNEYSLCLPRRGADGLEERWFNFVAQPIREPNGSDDGVLLLAIEITDSVTARRKVELLAGELQDAGRSKDEFLAMLSHELRNPLSPILTALQLMKLQKSAEGATRERDVIERQVKHLARLVDDLLDVSRATNGKISLRREPVTLATVIANGIEVVKPFIEARQHELIVDDLEPDVHLEGDPVRLAQVVSNLLNNAAKYTSPGGWISISAAREEGQAVLRVRDNGQGMRPERMASMFDLFVQGDQTLARSDGGLGIGLTLVRTLVQLHGGTVEARSEGLGQGSEFVVRLPALPGGRAWSEQKSGASDALSRARRVLVVDDNVDAASTLSEALRQVGHDVREEHDGQAALLAANEFKPDVVLLDLGLPGTDGFEVARRLHANPRLAELRIVAVTGYGQEADRKRTRQVGIELHLVKPVDLDDVIRAVAAR